MDNNELIKKAIDMAAIASGSEMNPEQSDRFIDLTVDESVLLKQVRIHKTDNSKGEIDKRNIGEPVTEKASENPEAVYTAYSSTPGASEAYLYDPTFAKIEYSVVKTRSAFNVTKEASQANIERDDLRDTLMGAFAKRMSTDLELLALMGDSIAWGGSNTKMGRLLKTNNGWYYLCANATADSPGTAHIVNAGAKNISKYLFSKMIKTMPKKYLMLFDELVFYVSPTIYQNYLEELAERNTNLGDVALTGKTGLTAFGIPIKRVPLISEDMTYPYGTTTNSGTFIMLTVPTNLIVAILRQFETYWEFKPRADRWENTTYSQSDFNIENKDAIVVANNISVVAAAGYGE